LAEQLEQLGIKPLAIRYIGLANSHIDHIGNIPMFLSAMVLLQKSEWEFAQTHRFEGGLQWQDIPILIATARHRSSSGG
jgi:glyoxylase-like metal-dependent hydrolase (beta-lactamase superfamily II)